MFEGGKDKVTDIYVSSILCLAVSLLTVLTYLFGITKLVSIKCRNLFMKHIFCLICRLTISGIREHTSPLQNGYTFEDWKES